MNLCATTNQDFVSKCWIDSRPTILSRSNTKSFAAEEHLDASVSESVCGSGSNKRLNKENKMQNSQEGSKSSRLPSCTLINPLWFNQHFYLRSKQRKREKDYYCELYKRKNYTIVLKAPSFDGFKESVCLAEQQENYRLCFS